MSLQVQRLPRAEEDLLEIWLYIAAHNVSAADRLLDRIDERLRNLAQTPEMGQARPDIAPDLRMLPVEAYLILYRITPEAIEVARVVHSARQLNKLA